MVLLACRAVALLLAGVGVAKGLDFSLDDRDQPVSTFVALYGGAALSLFVCAMASLAIHRRSQSRDEMQTDVRVALLSGAIRAGRDLRELIGPTGGGIPARDDAPKDLHKRNQEAVIQWTCKVWAVLKRHYPQHADEFFGEQLRSLGKLGIPSNVADEMDRLGSVDAYLDAKLSHLAELLRRYDV